MLRQAMHLFLGLKYKPLLVVRSISCCVVFLSVFVLVFPVVTKEMLILSDKALKRIVEVYGVNGQKRVLEWQKLIQEPPAGNELDIIDKVNQFFNKIEFIADDIHWEKKDYWATPIEFLGSGGGDCEDFSIAKYATLKALGVDETKLNITYVKSLKLKQAHMVLTYFSTPGSTPLVIDNLTNQILSAPKRTDLLPIYSFNGTGLWLAKQQGRGKFVGSSNRLKLWRETLERMADDFN